MKTEPFVVTPNNYNRPLNVLDTKVTLLASNPATANYEITVQEGREGTGPPPHSHPWDEAFFVLAGTVEFSFAGQTVVCVPGTLVHLPGGTVHSFRYGVGGGKALEITGQGSAASHMFTSIDQEILPDLPDIPKAVEILKNNGVTVAV